MTSLLPVLQAIAADQASAARAIDLAIVTEVFSNEGGSGDAHPSVNARVRGSALELNRVPVMVGRIGMSYVPQVGDLVVVGYPGGQLDGAVVLGSLYDDQHQPPDAAPNEVVYQVPDGGEEGIRRVEVILDDDKRVTVEEAHVEIVMGSTSLRVETDGNVVVDAAGDISLTAGGDIKMEARGDIKAEAINVEIAAQANADLTASAAATVEGGATTKVKGAMVTVAGIIQFSAS